MQAGEVTQLLTAMGSGSNSASEELLSVVYDELRMLAGSMFGHQRAGHTLQPTALVHEAYIKLVGPLEAEREWDGRSHFFCVASKAMRQILISHARSKRTAKRGGDLERVTLTTISFTKRPIDLLLLEEALEELERIDERQCRMVEMRTFGGLENEQIARMLDVSVRTVQLELKMARAWLLSRIDDEADT